MIALDTNVIIDIEEGTPQSAERAVRAIERAGERAGIVICGIVYAELHARPQHAANDLDDALRTARIAVDLQLTAEIWREALPHRGREQHDRAIVSKFKANAIARPHVEQGANPLR